MVSLGLALVDAAGGHAVTGVAVRNKVKKVEA